LFKNVQIAVLNRDDDSFSYLDSVRTPGSRLITYALVEKADFTPKKFKFKTSLPGQYNQYNCLAAIAVASALGMTRKTIKKAIFDFGGIRGRMDEVDLGQDFKVFIDFAHTPNALKRVLMTLGKKKARARLIVVFGCAGLRDAYKRPQMGKIAAELADAIVLTAEDPRTEDADQIINQIVQGCLKKGAKEIDFHKLDVSIHKTKKPVFFRVPDRTEAIKFAIGKLAQKSDIVVVCGKGHEQSMCYGRIERPWSEHQEVKKALKERLKIKGFGKHISQSRSPK
jgi:UDP-N-acetylmuramoyl-L-alanyl-D-glutamate--2,6-diaminopimelate ligase